MTDIWRYVKEHPQMWPLLCGIFSGWTEVTTTHWIDVIKTRMQIDKTKVVPTIKKIFHEKSFYRGFWPRFLGIGPMRMSFWGSQKIIHDYLSGKKISDVTKLTLVGIGSSFCQTIVDSQIEYFKTVQIARSKGSVKQLIRGFNPTLMRNMGFAVVFQNMVHLEKSNVSSNNEYVNKLLLPGVAGATASLSTQFLDNVKTKVQANQDVTFTQALKKIGPHNFMRGAVPRATLGFFNMGIGYFAFNFFMLMPIGNTHKM